ncbi:MAG: radical SAM protein [Clostridia bacterium]
MYIKLIQPAMKPRPMDTKMKTRMSPSLALLTLAKLTPKEHKIVIKNENVECIDFDEPVDLVAITVTVDVMNRACEIANEFQKRGIKVIAGGTHITSDPEKCEGKFDSICIGMAERIWHQILQDVESDRLKPMYFDMEGFRGGEIVSPDYSKIDRNKYLFTNIVSTSRGCTFCCDFCYNSCEKALGHYVNRPVEDVMQDIQSLNTKHILFIDDNFIGDPKYTSALLKVLKPMKLKWNAAVTSNILDMLDLLDEMRDSGCQSLFIGFESVNPKAIESVHKVQNRVSKYERLVSEVHKRGIMVNASFVFGIDEDDVSVFQSTLDWIVKNRIETVTSHILTPYPGTKLHKSFLAQGRIIDSDLSHYNTAHVVFQPKGMKVEELFNGYLWIYKKVYSFRNILKRIPKNKKQVFSYLAFNLLYRKFGKFSEMVCELLSFHRIGRLAKWIAYKIK